MRAYNDNNTDRHSVGSADIEEENTSTIDTLSVNRSQADLFRSTFSPTRKYQKSCSNRHAAILADADSGTYSGMEDECDDSSQQNTNSDILSHGEDDEEVDSNSFVSFADKRKNVSNNLTEYLHEKSYKLHSKTIANAIEEILKRLAELLDETPQVTDLAGKRNGLNADEEAEFHEDPNDLERKKIEMFFENLIGHAEKFAIASRDHLRQESVGKSSSSINFPLGSAPLPPPPPAPPSSAIRVSNGVNNASNFPRTPPPPAPPKIINPPPPPPLGNEAKHNGKSFSPIGLKTNTVDIPKALRLKCVPPEGKKFRHLQWTKVPARLATKPTVTVDSNPTDTITQEGKSIWQNMDQIDSLLSDKLNFSELDIYFSCVDHSSNVANLNFGGKTAAPLSVSPQPKPAQIRLISEKRNLSINVFLKMCKNDALIEHIAKSDGEAIGVERLKMLLPLLPNDEEQKTLRHYTGDLNAIGQAENFLLGLMGIHDFKLRIEAMCLRLEFDTLMADIEPGLQTLIFACKELISSKCLQKILYVLLHAGNYLNHGAAVGNALGFKLNSLWKINEMRATGSASLPTNTTKSSPRTLLHFIAERVNNCGVEFEKEITHVPDAAKLSFETLQTDLGSLSQRIQRFDTQSRTKFDDDFFSEFKKFVAASKIRLNSSTQRIQEVESLRTGLAIYFCEEPKTFSMEECFKIFAAFLNAFKAASNDNCTATKSKPTNIVTDDRGQIQCQNILQIASNESTLNDADESTQLDSFYLNNFNLSAPPTPRLKTPRHSIHISEDSGYGNLSRKNSLLLSANNSPKLRRTSLIIPDGEGRDRQRELSQMLIVNYASDINGGGNVIRRRMSAAIGNQAFSDENTDSTPFIRNSRERKSNRLERIEDESRVRKTPIQGPGPNEECTGKSEMPNIAKNTSDAQKCTSAQNEGQSQITRSILSIPIGEESSFGITSMNKLSSSSVKIDIKSASNQSVSQDLRPDMRLKTKSDMESGIRSESSDMKAESVKTASIISTGIPMKTRFSYSKDPRTLRSTSSISKSPVNDRSKPDSSNHIGHGTIEVTDNRIKLDANGTKAASEDKMAAPISFPSALSTSAVIRRANLHRIRIRKSMADKEPTVRSSPNVLRPSEIRASEKRLSEKKTANYLMGLGSKSPGNDLLRDSKYESLKTSRTTGLSLNSVVIKDSKSMGSSLNSSGNDSLKSLKYEPLTRSSSNSMWNDSMKRLEYGQLRGLKLTDSDPSSPRNNSFKSLKHEPSRTSRSSNLNLKSADSNPKKTTRNISGSELINSRRINFNRSNRSSSNSIKSNTNSASNRSSSMASNKIKIKPSSSNAASTKIDSSTAENKSSSLSSKLTTSNKAGNSSESALLKHKIMMKPTSSVSTASRPALIKTGSMASESGKPRWI